MEIKILDTNNPTQLEVIGRVDTITAADFQKQVEAIFAEHTQDMVFDCKGLTFLSSAGLRAFFILSRKANAAKTTISLKNIADNVLEVLKISGFDALFKIIK